MIYKKQTGDVGAKQLAYALRHGAGDDLRDLDLSWNSISVAGAAPLFHALQDGSSPRLQRLRLFWNYIGKCV